MGLGWPALTFTPYGLAGGWDAPRWLASVEGPLGHPAVGIRLKHGWTQERDPERPWLEITTLRKDRYADFKPEPVADPGDAAFTATFGLVERTMPAPLERPDEYRERIVGFAERRAKDHHEWPTATWSIDGRGAVASIFRWAGAWAGFTSAAPECDVVVMGFGIEPGGLALTALHDTSPYHFHATQPLSLPETLPRSQEAALAHLGGDGGLDVDRPWPAHPDHDSVLW
ncbi:hypothetical protein ENKNEFLB_02283 [Nocardioides aquaticus]|uniref:DUF317 domain-containing protein n=1 Tax=Nocardioides aquaticus TaxID=160826 RepID=A0ABX8EMR7_9ACTN|nr:hypothetical protein [Nocardioides aquaticus]QVT79893.1 hypothetical protein ENKNEFLB_02283 [Nocardioides aquaticus]